jgi:hypothetical protein
MCKGSKLRTKIFHIKILKDLHPGRSTEKTPPVKKKTRNGSRNSKKKAA